jgi:hypothetical protein
VAKIAENVNKFRFRFNDTPKRKLAMFKRSLTYWLGVLLAIEVGLCLGLLLTVAFAVGIW